MLNSPIHKGIMKLSKLISLLTVTGLLAAPQAFAGEITITDSGSATTWGFGGGPYGIAGEDNETEEGTVRSQDWDMEAFVLDSSGILSMVGGYDLVNGEWGSNQWLTPGDLFIKIGGAAPSNQPLADPSGGVIANGYGYNYVIDLTYAGEGRDGISASRTVANVYSVDSSAMFETVVYDQFGANPWRYLSGGTLIGTTSIDYTSGLTDTQTLTATGVSLVGGLHNILDIDLGFLSSDPSITDTTSIWYSNTMECGNDSLKGLSQGNPDILVPDSTSSLLLAGLGLGLMAMVGQLAAKRRSSGR